MSQAHRSPATVSQASASELLDRYARGPAELRLKYSDLSREQLLARPIAGKWSPLEVLCHLADCEQFFADRIKRTLAMDRPLLMGADGSHYPDPLHYQQRDVEEELSIIEITRAQLSRILRQSDDSIWSRQAVHSEAGLISAEELVRHAVMHQAGHLLHLEEKRRAFGLI